MKSQENIVSYTLEELLELNRRGETGSDWDRINSMSRADIERLADEDMAKHGFSAETYNHGFFTTEPLIHESPIETVQVEAIEADRQSVLLVWYDALTRSYHQVLGTNKYISVETTGSKTLAA